VETKENPIMSKKITEGAAILGIEEILESLTDEQRDSVLKYFNTRYDFKPEPVYVGHGNTGKARSTYGRVKDVPASVREEHGETIRKIRLRAGMTQKKFVEVCGLKAGYSQLSYIESGRKAPLDDDEITKISDAVVVSFEELQLLRYHANYGK
jgi:DNA-binding transcriptional regulator YiaG